MADNSAQLVVEGLARAAAEPDGLPLHCSKNARGIFPATARQAAQACKKAGYLQVVRTETNGKKPREICAITDAGVAYLLGRVKRPLPPSANGLWKKAALAFLSQWTASHSYEDCSLPELYRHARQAAPDLSIGQFHDGLRQLHESGQVYLHPWTGPLHEIPDAALALMVGHAVIYYVSHRNV